MPVYKLLAGLHSHSKIPGKNKAHIYRKGDVFRSPTELEHLNQPPHSVKFARLPDNTVVPEESAGVESSSPSSEESAQISKTQPNLSTDTLDTMSVEELRRLAAEEEISLDGAKTKAQIIEAIRKVDS